MEQTNLSLGEIKKLRREMRSMNQSLDHLKNDMEGIHQTLSNGLQKIFSEIEKLKLDNHKIKSNLKYVMKMKTNISWESSFYSDSDVRCNPLMHGSRESLGYFKGNLTAYHLVSIIQDNAVLIIYFLFDKKVKKKRIYKKQLETDIL